MKFVKALTTIAKGAAAGVALGVALPVFGAVGTITATGTAIASIGGAALGLADAVKEDDE
ncbi:hypothetical protein [Vibrio alfacsensis]|uniref:hypothetical protein n=1 Tax=Vibrio alfacsensis TaxID=1074311 RepID=UPI004067C8A9